MRCITHCKLYIWHVVIFRSMINTCMVYNKGKAWIITLTQLTEYLSETFISLLLGELILVPYSTCWKMSVSVINLSLHCRFPPSTVTSPLHTSYKLMKHRHDAISIFTVQYKAINKTAWITVNNLRDVINVALNMCHTTPPPTPVSVKKHNNNKYGPQKNAPGRSPEPAVLDNPSIPDSTPLPTHRYTCTTQQHPQSAGLGSGWELGCDKSAETLTVNFMPGDNELPPETALAGRELRCGKTLTMR